MYKIVEINPCQAKPPPLASPLPVAKPKPKPKPKKVHLPEEKILELIQLFEERAKSYKYWKKKYDRISKKYDEDLAEFIKRERKNLPKGDWGKRVDYFYRHSKQSNGKLEFYQKLLKKVQQEKGKKEATKEEAESKA